MNKVDTSCHIFLTDSLNFDTLDCQVFLCLF